jgi:hypothetical protein
VERQLDKGNPYEQDKAIWVIAFSRQVLIDQLIFEGYTSKQAQYGVAQTGI